MKTKSKQKDNKFVVKNKEENQSITTYSSAYEGQSYDIMLHAWLGRFTCWLSPASLGMAAFDWLSHFLLSPAKQVNLVKSANESAARFALQMAANTGLAYCPNELVCIQHVQRDPRFKDTAWDIFPFNVYSQVFLMCEKWCNEATTGTKGVWKHHEDVLNFTVRQMLDMFSPSNNPFTNPEILSTTFEQGGVNFVNGFKNFIEDYYRSTFKLPPAGSEKFRVGEDVAITPGKVVYRNHLIELIQYEPKTKEVYAEPILFIPAWIMKYYILDLSKRNSLVRYLVNHGHTVFMISWKNPGSDDRNLGIEDYIHLGIMNSLKVIGDIIPDKKIHATGYCLGGTLLMIAAAAMAALGEDRLKTVTLFAAQVDFQDPGELSLYIDQSQVSYLEDIMWEKGYLDGNQMAWAFSMLRSNDLIWSRVIHDYFLGKRRPINDLMAWDHDTTRLPFRMHSQYLHSLFLNNDIIRGRYEVNKKRIALTDIKQPVFAVATLKDHVSPWRSVHKIELYTNTEVTFLLTNGGHNAGIISEPGHKGRSYQIKTRQLGEKHMSSDAWLDKAPKYEGSWWPAWQEWLVNHSSEKISVPNLGDPKKEHPILCDAPGTYVLEK